MPLRVLVFSQQQRFLTTTISSLAEEGYEVRGTASETEAAQRFQTGACDILLYNLPSRSDGDTPFTLVFLRFGPRASVGVLSPGVKPLFLDEREVRREAALRENRKRRRAEELARRAS